MRLLTSSLLSANHSRKIPIWISSDFQQLIKHYILGSKNALFIYSTWQYINLCHNTIQKDRMCVFARNSFSVCNFPDWIVSAITSQKCFKTLELDYVSKFFPAKNYFVTAFINWLISSSQMNGRKSFCPVIFYS